jgi:hypothetical protein
MTLVMNIRVRLKLRSIKVILGVMILCCVKVFLCSLVTVVCIINYLLFNFCYIIDLISSYWSSLFTRLLIITYFRLFWLKAPLVMFIVLFSKEGLCYKRAPVVFLKLLTLLNYDYRFELTVEKLYRLDFLSGSIDILP